MSRFLVLRGLAGCGLAGLALVGFKPESAVVGSPVAEFRLRDVTNKSVSLADFKGAKGFIVVFTCNHCPFAKLYTARLNTLNIRYKALGVPLLAINSMDTVVYAEESFRHMQRRAQVEQFNFPYLHDARQAVGRNFRAAHTPQTYVIWREAQAWQIKYSGAIDDNGAEPGRVKNAYVVRAVEALLAGQPVAKPQTDSFGCAIFFRKQLQ